MGGNDTSTPAGDTREIGFDAPYVSDLRFLALPGIPTSPTTTTPTDTTTTTPAAPVGPPPEIENVHTTALTPFSATIAWRTSVPASSRIAYGLDAPVIWTPASGASTEHQATLTGLGFDDSYKLAVTAVNDGGAARVAEFVLTTPSLSGPVQMTTSNGAILLNGQPSFPKLVWAQCPDAAAGNLAVGIDLFMGNGCGT
ncbi:MAG TPA: fibronectin type III domain-containing protein, partial [Gaiellaceae bacterium]|nr:fibronectin type III domain-containing protein [Gaiellaceae bacterium]